MSSLYDKYHSEHNRTYMYNLIKNIIIKDHKFDVSNNDTYNHFFKTNFINTFKTVDTEDIKDLNNHLLNTQLDYVQDFILKEKKLTEQDIDTITSEYLIHSFQRNINLSNSSRHNFRIKNPNKNNHFQIEKVIIPIEKSSLFMNPTMIISIDTSYIDLHLRGTIQLRNREYGIYTPYFEKSFQINSDVCRIQFKNQLFDVRKQCDVYKVISTNTKKIIIDTDNINEFKVDDYIRVCNFENIEVSDEACLSYQFRVKSVIDTDDKIELKLDKVANIKEGLYIMNMSLQNTIHLINN